MRDVRTTLSLDNIAKLRLAYDPAALVAANVVATATIYPPLKGWADEVAATFYASDAPITPIDRERSLIALLAYTGPPMALSVHVYWGLMEGLSMPEVCHTVALVGYYGGLTKVSAGLFVVDRVAGLLGRLADGDTCEAADVLAALIAEFRAGNGG